MKTLNCLLLLFIAINNFWLHADSFSVFNGNQFVNKVADLLAFDISFLWSSHFWVLVFIIESKLKSPVKE